MITNFNNFVNESLTGSFLVTHFALQNTKFGNEKGKVQKPARIPPQTPPAGGKSAEAGRSIPPDKLFRPAESALVVLIIWILLEIISNFVQNIPPKNEIGFGTKNMVGTKCRLF